MKQACLTLSLLFCFAILQAQDESDTIPAGQESNAAFIDGGEITHTTVEPKSLTGTQTYHADKINVRKFDRSKWKKIVGSTNYEEKPEALKSEVLG